MKVLHVSCPWNPLDDPKVLEKFKDVGWTEILWKCPDCGQRWIASGTPTSKTARRAHWTIFGWRT